MLRNSFFGIRVNPNNYTIHSILKSDIQIRSYPLNFYASSRKRQSEIVFRFEKMFFFYFLNYSFKYFRLRITSCVHLVYFNSQQNCCLSEMGQQEASVNRMRQQWEEEEGEGGVGRQANIALAQSYPEVPRMVTNRLFVIFTDYFNNFALLSFLLSIYDCIRKMIPFTFLHKTQKFRSSSPK